MTALKWITSEAKKLKKKYPKRFTTWREYVAQASAIYAKKHKGKSPVGKKRKAVKKVGAVKKKATPKSVHKDTKSHNVNIRVVSGIVGSVDIYKTYVKMISETENEIKKYQELAKQTKDNYQRYTYRLHIKRLKDALSVLKKQKQLQKKLI